MKVLVTGATGFVGQEVARQLQQAGHGVRILARDPDAPSVQAIRSLDGMEVHRGEILDSATLSGAARGVEAVVHLVGIISEVGQNTFGNVHTRGTQKIVTAAQQAGVRRFVHMSALGTRPGAASRYHQTKWSAEEIVRQSGLDFTIFRPSLIFGPRDAFVNLFARIIDLSPVVPLLGSPDVRFQPVSVEVVADAFVRSLREPMSFGQTYDLCGPQALTLSEMVDCIQRVLHRRRWKLRVPSWLSQSQAALLEFIYPRMLGRAPPLNRDQLVMLRENNPGDPRPANTLLGLRAVALEEGISSYLRK
jgi:uncharacterized protein YbjT (DUF2867 family)